MKEYTLKSGQFEPRYFRRFMKRLEKALEKQTDKERKEILNQLGIMEIKPKKKKDK